MESEDLGRFFKRKKIDWRKIPGVKIVEGCGYCKKGPHPNTPGTYHCSVCGKTFMIVDDGKPGMTFRKPTFREKLQILSMFKEAKKSGLRKNGNSECGN